MEKIVVLLTSQFNPVIVLSAAFCFHGCSLFHSSAKETLEEEFFICKSSGIIIKIFLFYFYDRRDDPFPSPILTATSSLKNTLLVAWGLNSPTVLLCK